MSLSHATVSATAPDDVAAKASPAQQGSRHTPGLPLLCVIEGCERFAATSLGSVLVLYMTEQRGAQAAEALRLVGTFNALCYLAPIVGGLLSDQILGRWRAMLSGAVLMALAYSVLGFALSPSLPLVLLLLIAGHGLFKPSINALVSSLYDVMDLRRDAAHSWFYFAVNLGSLFAPLVAGVLRVRWGWSAVFVVAAGSLAVGTLTLLVSSQLLRCRDLKPTPVVRAVSTKRTVVLPRRPSRAAFLAIGLTVVVSAAAFAQCDGSLLLWARDDVQLVVLGHQMPVSWFAALPALLVLVLGPLLTIVEGQAVRSGPAAPRKILAGLRCIGLAFVLLAVAARWHQPGELAGPAWMVAAYFLLTIGELMVVPLTQALLTELVPASRAGLASGLWFACLAGGYWLAGMLGAYWSVIPHEYFFAGIAILVSAAGFAASGPIRSHTRSCSRQFE